MSDGATIEQVTLRRMPQLRPRDQLWDVPDGVLLEELARRTLTCVFVLHMHKDGDGEGEGHTMIYWGGTEWGCKDSPAQHTADAINLGISALQSMADGEGERGSVC